MFWRGGGRRTLGRDFGSCCEEGGFEVGEVGGPATPANGAGGAAPACRWGHDKGFPLACPAAAEPLPRTDEAAKEGSRPPMSYEVSAEGSGGNLRRPGWERDSNGNRRKEKRTGTCVMNGRWVILWPKSSWKKGGDLLLSLYYVKAAFGCGFGWQSNPLVGLLAFGKSKSS
jgi:hypothetical protein